jgi:hypothetical protein
VGKIEGKIFLGGQGIHGRIILKLTSKVWCKGVELDLSGRDGANGGFL